MLRPNPVFYFNLLRSDPPSRFDQGFTFASPGTEFAIAVRRHLDAQHFGSEMRNMAKESHRGFFVAVLEFAVGGTHPAK